MPKEKIATLYVWLFSDSVPGAGVENMDIVKCKNKFLNPYYRCILLEYK